VNSRSGDSAWSNCIRSASLPASLVKYIAVNRMVQPRMINAIPVPTYDLTQYPIKLGW